MDDATYGAAGAHAAMESAIADLYRVFAHYRPREVVTRSGSACPDSRLLLSRPLDQLGWHELLRYGWKAMTLLGDADDYRHFLPRLLELLAFDPPHFNEEVILYNIRLDWQTWSVAEQSAITRWLQALWRLTLTTYDPIHRERVVADCLCCVAQLADDLAPFLAEWEAFTIPSAIYLLADHVRANGESLSQHSTLENVWWSERNAQMRQAVTWLLGGPPGEMLESAYLRDAKAPYAGELATAADWLAGLRTWR
jgi:hypothetical protein